MLVWAPENLLCQTLLVYYESHPRYVQPGAISGAGRPMKFWYERDGVGPRWPWYFDPTLALP